MGDRWENFWKSGRVEDYLEYRKVGCGVTPGNHTVGDAAGVSQMERKDTDDYGAVRGAYGDGAERDAAWRVR